jgi:hypothetical protein
MNKYYPLILQLTRIILLPFWLINCAEAKFIDDFSHLKKFLDKPAVSSFHVGFGITPIGLIGDKTYSGVSILQIHYIKDKLDFNILSADYGIIRSGNKFAQAKNFALKTSPKLRIAEIFENTTLSAGPIFGLEFIAFDNVRTQLRKGNYVTITDNLSAYAPVWGFAIEETIHFSKYLIKVTQAFYKQSYSITDADNGWYHFYENPEAEKEENQKLMRANNVFLLSISMLF